MKYFGSDKEDSIMKKLLVLISLPIFCLCSCARQQQEPKEKPINVFVLAGQSNMEGNTQFDDGDGKHYLQDGLAELNIDESVDNLKQGIPEVQTSYYIGPAFDPSDRHGSNEEDNIAGKFLPTVLGMGAGDVKDQFGPEVGAAYVLKDYASEDEPIYFVKAAYGGSSITSNWNINSESGLYQSHLVKFLNNNLKLIEEETGEKPVVKGLLWHQGENDVRNGSSTYKANLSALVSKFRADFAEYAPDEDGENIAFIDCYIFDKGDSDSASLPSGANLGQTKVLNNGKKEFAEEGDMNFVVNSSWQYESGLKLQVNESASGVDHGGVGGQHYWARDMFKLGMEYANIIVENNLLD